jgi:serine O-acetyltransferase
MIFEIPKEDILKGMIRQLTSFFSVSEDEVNVLNSLSEAVFKRCEINFSKNNNKYYSREGEVYFNPYHSGQYTVFLYYFSNSIFKKEQNYLKLADKIYYLNRVMNSCDLFYEVELPEFFMLDHPLGAVMGRGKFGNYFAFSQNCTVGNNNNIFPIIGEHVTMTANSMILGNSKIGNNVILGAGACVKDQDIPDNSIVFGSSPNLIIKKKNFKTCPIY